MKKPATTRIEANTKPFKREKLQEEEY